MLGLFSIDGMRAMRDTQTSVLQWNKLDAYRLELVAQAQRRGLTSEEAEDVASEAILRAGSKPDLDLDRAERWLRRVTRNLAVDAYRARLSPHVASRLAHASDDAALEPQSAVDDQLEACWVAQVVTRLPARQQLVLHHKAAGHSLQEIAALLDVPYKTVESLASRARANVRAALASALGLIALLGGWLRRGTRATASAALVAAGTLALSFPLFPHDLAPDRAGPAPVALPVVSRMGIRAAVDLNPTTSLPAIGTPSGIAPMMTHQQIVPPGRVGPVQHSGLKTTRRDSDRTFIESVSDCLHGGIEVTPENIGCAD